MSIRLDRTGIVKMDLILDAIEEAASMYHNTNQWHEVEEDSQRSPIDTINAQIRYARLRTPAEQLGYKVGDKFVILDCGTSTLTAGRIISLYDDDGTDCLLFKIEDGLGCEYDFCDGLPGQHVNLNHVRPLGEQE